MTGNFMATFLSSSGSSERSGTQKKSVKSQFALTSKLISQSGCKSCNIPNSWGSTECPSEYAMYFHLPVRSMYVEEFTLHPWNSLNTHGGRDSTSEGDTLFSAFPRSSGIREYPLRFCGTGILAISKQRYTKVNKVKVLLQ